MVAETMYSQITLKGWCRSSRTDIIDDCADFSVIVSSCTTAHGLQCLTMNGELFRDVVRFNAESGCTYWDITAFLRWMPVLEYLLFKGGERQSPLSSLTTVYNEGAIHAGEAEGASLLVPRLKTLRLVGDRTSAGHSWRAAYFSSALYSCCRSRQQWGSPLESLILAGSLSLSTSDLMWLSRYVSISFDTNSDNY